MRIPPVTSGWPPPDGFGAGAVALGAWLEPSRDPKAEPGPTVYSAIEAVSKQLRSESETSRTKLLEDIALQRTSMAAIRADLDLLAWANGTLYHAWRLAESLRRASGK